MTIGEYIKQTRQLLGITQKELSSKAGISYQQLSQYERGVRSPSPETLNKIVSSMGFHFPEFMQMYYSSLSNVCDDDKDFLRRVPIEQKEPLTDNLDALKKLMNANGYDLGISRGEYYLIGKDGAYQLSEEQLQNLLNGTVQYVESLCAMLESMLSHFPGGIVP